MERECGPSARVWAFTKRLFHIKLNAYGFDNKAVRFSYKCLTSFEQIGKRFDKYYSWQEVLLQMSQGSILILLQFNIEIWYYGRL